MDRTKITVPADVLEGLEAVRRSGKTNMFDVPVVIRLAYEMEHYATALWVDENRSLYIEGVFNGFCAEGGDPGCAD